MIRLHVVVEGDTEEELVKRVLGPHLDERGVFTSPINERGGGSWQRWRRDLRRIVGEQRGADARFTTLFDLYGLPKDFPRLEEAKRTADTAKRVGMLQEAMSAEVGDPRFIPYLQRHEVEALVLACLAQLESVLDSRDDLDGLKRLRNEIQHLAPEDVDDGPETAPSKRLKSRIRSYDKKLHGPLALEAAGLSTIRAACPRFHAWVASLETLNEELAAHDDVKGGAR